MPDSVTVSVELEAPLERAWEVFTNPAWIVSWNFASDDWRCPRAVNDLRAGGSYSWRMESADGSQGFDFSGRYLRVIPLALLESVLDDGRAVRTSFERLAEHRCRVSTAFEPEGSMPAELQRQGWQAILDNYKKRVESAGAAGRESGR